MNRLLAGFCFGIHVLFATACAQTPGPDTSGTSQAYPTPTSSYTPVVENYAPLPKESKKLGYNSIYVEGPYVALTFDDGPHGVLTPRLLEILKKKNVKATFFLVGQCAQEFPDIVRRTAEEGHEVANHSYAHSNYKRMSDAAVRADLERTSDIIKQASGHQPTLMRPPYGSLSTHQKEWINKDLGMKVVLWSVDPLDWKNRNSAVVESRILSNTSSGAIILAHDIHKTTVEAMEDTIDQLYARGFKFVTVSELISMEKPRPTPTPSPTPAASVSGTSPAPAQNVQGTGKGSHERSRNRTTR